MSAKRLAETWGAKYYREQWLPKRAAQGRNIQNMRLRGTRPLGGGPGMYGRYSPKVDSGKPNSYGNVQRRSRA